MAETAGAARALYQEPREVKSLEDCYFYHTMDLPNYGTVKGEWDLRGQIDDYLGNFDFNGRRVLDVGAASGILSFHAERKGAEVVSFDLSEDYDWDIVPFYKNNNPGLRRNRRQHLRRINNSYWLCHAEYKSRARMVHGVVYDIPAKIGPVDVAIYGSILLHLRDPFLALENGARLAQEAMIVADISPWSRFASRFLKSPKFVPKSTRPGKNDGWFRLPPLLVQEYLGILGYKKSTITWKTYDFGHKRVPLYTIVARR